MSSYQQTPVNSGLPEQVRRLLDQRPEKGTALIYQAVILALGIHIFVIALIYFSTAMPAGDAMNAGKEEEELEQFDLQFEEPEQLEAEQMNPEMAGQEARDLVASSRSGKTSEAISYTGKSQANIQAEVNAQLRGMEQAEFDRLKSGRSEVTEPIPTPADPNNKDQKNTQKENYDWFGKQSDKSFSGPVSAEFDLAGRSTRSTPRPMYRCPSPGKVVLRIEVDPSGNVTSVEIDEASSSPDECIRGEARNYAGNWKFDYSPNSPKKQKGKITFTFRGQ
jgi:TonB family protein